VHVPHILRGDGGLGFRAAVGNHGDGLTHSSGARTGSGTRADAHADAQLGARDDDAINCWLLNLDDDAWHGRTASHTTSRRSAFSRWNNRRTTRSRKRCRTA